MIYKGMTIEQDAELGYSARGSISEHFGYCDTLAELHAEIDDHLAEEAAHYAGIDTPADTPSLGAPHWAAR